MATVRSVVQSPLLNSPLGSSENDFQVSECVESGGEPGEVRKIAPLHRHRTEDEAWYVLDGCLRFQFGAEEFDAPKGAGVLLPHGTAHSFWNPRPDAARYLLIARPKTVALLEVLHDGTDRGSLSLRDLFSRYDIDLLE